MCFGQVYLDSVVKDLTFSASFYVLLYSYFPYSP